MKSREPSAPFSEPETTEDLRDLYDNAPCGYLSLSPNSCIVRANQTLAHWLGRPTDQLVGQSIHDILSFGGKIAFETHLAPLLRLQGHVHEIALDLMDAQDEKIPVIANAAERRGQNGEHLFTRLTLFKAVDRRKFERTLIEARLKAEAEKTAEQESAKLREQFIAVLGHDLRNPLGALRAGVRLLEDAQSLGEAERNVLSYMHGTIDRANALIDDILDFARGRLGDGLVLNLERSAHLGRLLAQVTREMATSYPERNIQAHLAVEGEVRCDADRIAQMLSNLLANAVSHGTRDTPISVTAETTNERFILTVNNRGRPIPEAIRNQLFKPFFRGEVSETRKGLGLGLYIVNEIAKAHGGRMDVACEGDEITFRFSMPRQLHTGHQAQSLTTPYAPSQP